MEPKLTGDEVVISGIAGKFPNSANVNELQEHLLNKIDCVTDSKDRWNFEHPQVPPRIGIMKDIDKFDRNFFGVHGKLTECMDPMLRMMIETTYEAITDAGINPRELRGSKSAVFTASTFSESEKSFFYEKTQANGIGLLGASRAMLSNRLSFFLGFTGPSINIDASCCGGITVLEEAFKAIKEKRAESAIIGCSNVVLHPNMSLQFRLLGLLSPDGITKSFDNAADGYTRSEAIVIFFLQRARDAKRIYAEVKSARMSIGNVNDNFSFFFPTHDFQSNIMKETLKEAGIKGKDISYVEADGSGIKEIDAEEVKAIDEVYNEGRNSPLLIGSIKSNVGSCSSTSPLNGIIKVITAMEKGCIPPNLNFKESSDKIPAFKEGRCKVVTELTPWTGDYAVVNSLALTGASANVVLKRYKKDKKNGGKPDDKLPRLVTVSGCTEEAVDVLLTELESKQLDVEMIQLMYDIFECETPAHLYRGYTILPPEELVKDKTRDIQFNTGLQRKIWYMFSGMGSQWVGMGEALLQIPVFKKAIMKCDRALKPRGIDILRIITDKNPQMFDNIVNSFVGIAAIQIGLVDVLDSVGVKPDFLIGHSVGELGCAYADGCFTAEQMVLAALSRGLASVETEMPRGSMAAVGLGYEEIKNLCPPDIDVACHNSAGSTTISGPVDSMKIFVKQLQEKNLFAKEVACSNIAYHSRYIAPAGEKLKKYLQEVIPNPKPRSDRWISSSVPYDEWKSARARLSSAEYHTNNLLNPVLFAETAKFIPSHATVIEIAPHGLLQAIVRKSLPKNVLNIPLTQRGNHDGVSFLLEGMGKIYNTGYNIKISKLYPKVNYPVSRGTPSISSLIRWDHSIKWYTNFFKLPKEIKNGQVKFTINLNDEKWKYLEHIKIDGKVLVPSSLYLILAGEVQKWLKNDSETSFVYHKVEIHKHPIVIPKYEDFLLVVMVQKGSGYFEISNKEDLLCSGIIQATDNHDQECSLIPKKDYTEYENLNESDIYTELQMRGLEYSGPFRIIQKSSSNGGNGILEWRDDWITFLEGMIQMHILGTDTRNTQVPIAIRKITINLKLHTETSNISKEIPVSMYRGLDTINAGGVQMEGVILKTISNEFRKNNIITEQILPGTITGTYKRFQISSNLKSTNEDSIAWVEQPSKESANTIKIEYSAINNKDILLANTKISLENTGRNRLKMKSFGQEYSGINSQGYRVMGIAPNVALSNYLTPDNDFTWRIPDNWSSEDAATVPLAYATAYLSLMILGKIKADKSVFVYNGSCSIGQAAINIAINITSQVFIGYANDIDKKNLRSRFENIPKNHFISTSGNFTDLIFTQMKKKAADIIIYNAEDLNKIEECTLCVRTETQIIIVGKFQKSFSKTIGMQFFNQAVGLSSVIPSNVINLDKDTKKILSHMIETGISKKIVKPLPRCVYSRDKLNDAFIHGSSKNVYGKVLIKVQTEEGKNKALTIPRFLCKSEASYLIIEGLSDFGLELVDFLIVRGARNIVIASKSKNTRAFSHHRISLWRGYGVSVTVQEELDLTRRENVNSLLDKVGTVNGIFDLQRLENSSTRSRNLNYLCTKHLFEESKRLCPNIRHFVVVSTCNDIGENIHDLLLQEIDLTKIVQPKSKGINGLLILLGPVSGIAKETNNKSNVRLLSIPSIIEQMEIVMGSKASIASISYKPLEDKSKKMKEEFQILTETEKSKFDKYINAIQPLTNSSWFHILKDKQSFL
ncbi:fatty acid synthase-like [Leptopilina heterotoma]|uniref:fatty acid synthase-like n=1 Tax=Leptopilina heterotoma TaxID=63436 RepID=UPI001CA8C506|nr:fatty acid synthase-like [Leptopilina heterotoma]